jgi:hypothetical protein
MRLCIAIIAFVVIGAAGSYAADKPAADTPARTVGTRHGVCSADIQKFCENVERGKGKVRECLTQHEADLSPACKTRIEKRMKNAN